MPLFAYGNFITIAINFIILAFIIFLMVRAINRLRLLLFVAHARHAFGGTPALTPSHIGRWVAFQERWPEVAGLMIGNPPLMGELEQAPTPDARRRLLAQLAGPVAKTFAEDEELRTFLAERKITLGPVMHRLIHLPPAD